jgi:hypothetical protein
MQSNLVIFPNAGAAKKNSTQTEEKTITNYDRAEEQFIELLAMEDLDAKLDLKPAVSLNRRSLWQFTPLMETIALMNRPGQTHLNIDEPELG